MYQQYYGLRELPFELTPNPRFLFFTERLREAQATLRHGLLTAKGFVVLTGEAGTGKTTLLRSVLEEAALQNLRCLYLNNPTLTRDEFVQFLANGFDLGASAAGSKTTLLDGLRRKLIADRAQGIVHALVIDEAQSLSHVLLEEIRLLANEETASEKLLSVILAGQPELADRLNEPALRQLKQRIALRCELAPLRLQETGSYIAARIRTAGGDAAKTFTRDAVILIHQRSGGIPRTISVICDNALVAGFALERRPVGRDVIREVCDDFDLGRLPNPDNDEPEDDDTGDEEPTMSAQRVTTTAERESTAGAPGATNTEKRKDADNRRADSTAA
jgi:general secretion pathway protein A